MSRGKIWVPAPPPQAGGPLRSGDIEGVYISSDEIVRWTWNNGRVTGYTIDKKLRLVKSSALGRQLKEAIM